MIASTTAATPRIPRPNYGELRLGTVTSVDPEVHVLNLVTNADRPAGAISGYETLRHATEDLQAASTGDYHGAVGIFRHRTAEGVRFFGQSIDMNYLQQSPHGWDGPYRDKYTELEHTAPGDVTYAPYRRGALAQELVRIVDGYGPALDVRSAS
jgi:hypothetical protein